MKNLQCLSGRIACGLSAFVVASLAVLIQTAPASAEILAQYHLGEAGSIGSDYRPLDTSGNLHNFIFYYQKNPLTGTASIVAPGVGGAPGSTAASYYSDYGFYEIGFSPLALTGDFKVDFWASPDPDTLSTVLFSTGNSSTDLRISILSTGSGTYDYVATYLGNATLDSVIGATAIGSGFAPTNAWTHIEVDSIGGMSTLSLNGVVQFGSATSPVTVPGNEYHFGVTPDGAATFTGRLDELTITSVPEPSTYAMALAGLACGGYLVRRRRKRA